MHVRSRISIDSCIPAIRDGVSRVLGNQADMWAVLPAHSLASSSPWFDDATLDAVFICYVMWRLRGGVG